MITKKEIEKAGLNPEHIKELGKAIVYEGSKDIMDVLYILEKTGRIEAFIEDIIREK